MADRVEDPMDGIAVIGMAGRFPGAEDLEVFWDNLCQARESVTFFSDDELLEWGVSFKLVNNPRFVKARASLPHIDRFDAAFFGFTPREAQVMDPQLRIFLETAWQALEHAGYAGKTQHRDIGLFAGSSFNTYLVQLAGHPELLELVGERQVMNTNDKDHLPLQTAYKLNLQGPCVNVQSGCTTALTATHFACQSLLDYQCDLALAGAVSIDAKPGFGYLHQEGGASSPDGHCRAFDAEGQGHLRGDGVGIVVLKRLEEALADGDSIVAVIKGSAINNDGSGKVGYTAPGIAGQTRAALAALAIAEVEPETLSYLEAYGTGSPLGDPMEVTALTKAFQKTTARKGFCAMGSVKTNIGHLDAASGMASLIKTCLALQNRQIPASLHFKKPNPRIDFETSPFFVNTALRDWAPQTHPNRACINAYGMGGANAFFVLEEAPPVASSRPAVSASLLLLAAKTPVALDVAAERLRQYLRAHPEVSLADIAYTLQVGREHWPQRRYLVAHSAGEAADRLATDGADSAASAHCEVSGREFLFVFPGGMDASSSGGRELYRAHPGLTRAIDLCLDLLPSRLREELRRWLTEPETTGTGNAGYLGPLSRFISEVALAQWLMTLGLRPSALLGTAGGEIAAACVAGVFSLADALALVAAEAGLEGGVAGVAGHTGMSLQAPQIPLLSTRTGQWLTDTQACDPAFWTNHDASLTHLDACLETLAQRSEPVLLVLGNTADIPPLMAPSAGSDRSPIAILQPRAGTVTEALLAGLGEAWLARADIDWQQLYGTEQRRRVPLPLYPFERKSYWVGPVPAGQVPAGQVPAGQASETEPRPKARLELEARPELSTAYVAARNEIEEVLVKALEDQFGIAPVGVEDHFFELGGTSLIAVLLAARLGEQFRVSLTPTLFMTTQTIAELGEQIAALKVDPALGSMDSPIVPLQPKGDRPPIFLIHPMGGGLFVYRDLAKHIGADQPLYGLQAADLTELDDEPTSLGDMASRYLEAITRFRPGGPYLIGGWSFGGFVAYEMACQLERSGREPELLIILDTPAPIETVTGLEELDDTEIFYGVARDAARAANLPDPALSEAVKQLSADDQLDHLMDFLTTNRLLPEGRDHDWMRRLARGWKLRNAAVKQYRPHAYHGRALLFRAQFQDEEQMRFFPADYRQLREQTLLGWDSLMPAVQLQVHHIPGYHNTIGMGNNAKKIAGHIRLAVNQIGMGERTKIDVGDL